MYTTGSPILCLDEYSSGLDAATMDDITRFLGSAVGIKGGIAIASLVQPSPGAYYEESTKHDGSPFASH